MAKKIEEPIRPEPFQQWLNDRIAFHQRKAEVEASRQGAAEVAGAIARVCDEIGWEVSDTTARKLYRWRKGMSDTRVGGRNGKHVPCPRKKGLERSEVEDALHQAGVDFYELYPEFAHERDGVPEPEAWCPSCQDHVMVVHNKAGEPVCIWCDWRMSDGHLNGLREAA